MFSFLGFIWLIILTAWVSNISRRVGGRAHPISQSSPVSQPISTAVPETQTAPLSSTATPSDHRGFEEVGSKWVGWLGVLAILLGLGFFFRYAIEQGWIGEGARVVIGIIAGLALAWFGNKMRLKYGGFADAIIGLGLGALFASVYSAQVLYDLIGAPAALISLIVISALGAFLSVKGKSAVPATLALAGAYIISLMMPGAYAHGLPLFALGISASSLFAARHLRVPGLGILALIGAGLSYIGWAINTDPTAWAQIGYASSFLVLFVVSSSLRHFGQNGEGENWVDTVLLFFGAYGFANGIWSVVSETWPSWDGPVALVTSVIFVILFVYGREKVPTGVMINRAYAAVATISFGFFIDYVIDDIALLSISFAAFAILLAAISNSIKEKAFLVFAFFAAAISASDAIEVLSARSSSESAVFNIAFVAILAATITAWVLAWAASREANRSLSSNGWQAVAVISMFIAHIFALTLISSETNLAFASRIEKLEQRVAIESQYAVQGVQGSDTNAADALYKVRSAEGATEIGLTALYAALLLVIGFSGRLVAVRISGLLVMFFALARVFLLVWELGSLARIIASVVAGVAAIGASFLYAKYKNQLLGKVGAND